jgi:hypothetical protein
MKSILVACLAFGAMTVGLSFKAHAEDPYWRAHHEVEWQDRATLKGPDYAKPDWLRGHCIRDWDGKELCRK